MRIAARAALLALAVVPAGCHLNNVCGSTRQELRADGGAAYSCLSAEDCPRPGNVFVCLNDAEPDKRCVRCEENRCVLIEPEFCRQ